MSEDELQFINIHNNPNWVFGSKECANSRCALNRRAGFRLCAITRGLDTLRSVLVQKIPEKNCRFCCRHLRNPFGVYNAYNCPPPPKKNPFYLLRFFHINKEISRHFPVQWRIQRKREESQISQPTFLSRVCRFSSSAL